MLLLLTTTTDTATSKEGKQEQKQEQEQEQEQEHQKVNNEQEEQKEENQDELLKKQLHINEIPLTRQYTECKQLIYTFEQFYDINTSFFDDEKEVEKEDQDQLQLVSKMHLYLRHVFHFCYFCTIQFQSFDELYYYCGTINHHIHPILYPMKHQTILNFLNQKDLSEHQFIYNIQMSYDIKLHDLNHIKIKSSMFYQEQMKKITLDNNQIAYQCTLCNKTFSAQKYVEKHVLNHHKQQFDQFIINNRKAVVLDYILYQYQQHAIHIYQRIRQYIFTKKKKKKSIFQM